MGNSRKPVNKRLIIYGQLLEIIVTTHRLKCDHLQQKHSQTKNVCFGRNIRVVVELLKLLYHN